VLIASCSFSRWCYGRVLRGVRLWHGKLCDCDSDQIAARLPRLRRRRRVKKQQQLLLSAWCMETAGRWRCYRVHQLGRRRWPLAARRCSAAWRDFDVMSAAAPASTGTRPLIGWLHDWHLDQWSHRHFKTYVARFFLFHGHPKNAPQLLLQRQCGLILPSNIT